MKGLLIFVALSSCVLARPDIGLKIREGYKYQPPATNYGVPTGSYLPPHGDSSQHQHGGIYQQPGSSSSFLNSGSGQFGAPDVSDYVRSGSSQQSYQASQGFNQGSQGGFSQGGNSGYSGQTSYQGGFDQGYQGNAGFSGGFSGQTQVHKHVYFYDSPEDLPAPTIRISGGAAAAQKNYKIIFIKAPSYQTPQVPQIPAQQQNEEKTLVYVLVKKPDEGADIVVPTLAPSKPSKPEVYFIKYKTQKEAEQHIQSIQQGSNSGVSANSVDNDAAFISTITDSKESSGSIGGQGHYTGGGITSTSLNEQNQQIFGGNQGHSGSQGTFNQGGDHHTYEGSSSSSHSVTGSSSSGQNFGPAGASGPY